MNCFIYLNIFMFYLCPVVRLYKEKKMMSNSDELSDLIESFCLFLCLDGCCASGYASKVVEATSHTFWIWRKFHESNVGNTRSTGLEPATSAVTGRCSNQLNYDPIEDYDTFKSAYSQFWNCWKLQLRILFDFVGNFIIFVWFVF